MSKRQDLLEVLTARANALPQSAEALGSKIKEKESVDIFHSPSTLDFLVAMLEAAGDPIVDTILDLSTLATVKGTEALHESVADVLLSARTVLLIGAAREEPIAAASVLETTAAICLEYASQLRGVGP